MGRWGQNLGQGLLQRMPVNSKQNSTLQKDNTDTVKLVNNQLPESRPKLRAIADLSRNSLKVVVRRRHSPHQKPQDGEIKERNARETLMALHDALTRKPQVQAIKYLVAKHPDGATAMKDGNLPLHTACMHKPSLEVVKYLLEAFPDGTGVRNKRYKLPIHVALECGASLEVIKALVSTDKEMLEFADYDVLSVKFEKVWITHQAKFSMENRAGLPLHTACKYLASLQVIHYLITEYPDAARTKNKDGWLPVHFSCARGAPLQTIQYLMTACPSSLYERTHHYYEYPMHLAAGRLNANINVVKYLQSRHSAACTLTKPNESLYLTYYDEAMLQSAPYWVIGFLSDVCNKAAKGYAYVSTAEDPYN